MGLPFCILKLGDGSPHFVEAAQTLDAAKARVKALAELLPGEYFIIHKMPKRGVLLLASYKSPKSKGKKGRWVVYERRLKKTE